MATSDISTPRPALPWPRRVRCPGSPAETPTAPAAGPPPRRPPRPPPQSAPRRLRAPARAAAAGQTHLPGVLLRTSSTTRGRKSPHRGAGRGAASW